MDKHIFDYSEITKNIIIGSNLCLGHNCEEHNKIFEKIGIDYEINLAKEKMENQKGRSWDYTWIPTPDSEPPSDAQIDLGTSIIDKAVKNKKKIYIHCKSGFGRAPTLVAAYLVRFKNMEVDEAVELIKKKRPTISINEAQLEALNKNKKRWSK